MQWILTSPAWSFLLVAVIAAGITFLFYKNSSKNFEIARPWIALMAFLRWAALSLLGLLLLNPLIKKVSNEKIEPVIIAIQDRTASISAGMDKNQLHTFQENYQKTLAEISKKYKVREYDFGTEILDSLNKSRAFQEKGTDIDKALTQVAQRSNGQHIGAVILSSDGIYNQGINPIYNTSFAGIPIYTIALGDTSTQKDMRVQRLRLNDLVYIGDEVEVLADLGAEYLDGKTVNVQLQDSRGNILQQKELSIKDREWHQTQAFTFEPQSAGIFKYKIKTTIFEGERITTNNQQDFYIQVIDGRQKVLLLYDAPHPDIKFIRETLREMKNIEVDVEQIDQWNNVNEKVDLLILHGLPSVKNKVANNKLQQALQKNSSVWWIYSAGTDITAFDQMQSLAKLSNVLKVQNEVLPSFSSNYQKFYVSEASQKWLQEVPPLVAPYGQLELAPIAEICWKQKIGSVETSQPLLVTGEQNQKITAILLGEGIWRWPMQEYFKYGHQNYSQEWVERLVQYIADKSDHRSFRVRTNKTIYNESEWIYLDASIYNESAQMVNSEDVKIVVTSDESYQDEFIMDKTPNAYSYSLGKLPTGTYKIEASSKLGQQTLKSEYRFAVQAFDIETNQIKADFGLMNTIALQNNGKMLTYSEVENLKDLIFQDERIQPIFKESAKTKSLLDFKWLLALIICLLSIEWFLRKLFGRY
ncbi:MAG: hypothetical protein M9887_00470 [Chitinophagales bacterium]|nr:hypothetical protein [Chitinophagales bacterium]